MYEGGTQLRGKYFTIENINISLNLITLYDINNETHFLSDEQYDVTYKFFLTTNL